MLDAGEFGKLRFQFPHLWPHDELTVLQYLIDARSNFQFEVTKLRLEVDERNTHFVTIFNPVKVS